jgi:hypothetical protein
MEFWPNAGIVNKMRTSVRKSMGLLPLAYARGSEKLPSRGSQSLKMIEEENDGSGGESAGVTTISVAMIKCAHGTAGAANAMVAIWASDEVCTSGRRKSCVQSAATAWLGTGCPWQGGTPVLGLSEAHEATHCTAPNISAKTSKATT